jgi:hypothetical protein
MSPMWVDESVLPRTNDFRDVARLEAARRAGCAHGFEQPASSHLFWQHAGSEAIVRAGGGDDRGTAFVRGVS